MVRHVLEGEYLYMLMVKHHGGLGQKKSPFAARPLATVADEVAFAGPFRDEFLFLIASYQPDELRSVTIDRSDVGYTPRLGGFLLRVAYHEAVYCGQMLGYLRAMGVERPSVWD